MRTDAGMIVREPIRASLADLVRRLSSATAAKHFCCLRQLSRWLVEHGNLRIAQGIG
jgi:hypothetical protein